MFLVVLVLGLVSATYAIEQEYAASGVVAFVMLCCITWSYTYGHGLS